MAIQQYTELDAILSLRKFFETHGTVSQYHYVKVKWKPSYPIYVNLFGGWNAAVEEAGLQIEKIGQLNSEREVISKEDVLNMLKYHISINSKFIFLKEYRAANLQPSVDMVTSRFGSWRNALIMLGIDVSRQGLLGKSQHRYIIAENVVCEAKENWGIE